VSRLSWKAGERRAAALVGGVRVPIPGRARGSEPDIAHPTLSLEVKTRATLPSWLLEAVDQAVKSRREGQVPLVLLHRDGDRWEEMLCLFRYIDLCQVELGDSLHAGEAS
jgi:hypothetical protein